MVTCEETSEKIVPENINNEIHNKVQGATNCDIGDKVVKTTNDQDLHKEAHTRFTLYQCAICEFESTNYSILNDHLKTKHTEKVHVIHKCNDCEQEFQYEFLLQNHICFRCYKCNFLAKSSKSLAAHNQANHEILKVQIASTIQLQCELCDYKSKYNIQLKKHMQNTHTIQDTYCKEFPCEECNLSFGTNKYLEDHIKANHSSAVACRLCGIPIAETEYQEHLIEFHESTVIMHTIAKQVDELHEKIETIETFKSELLNSIKSLKDVQNEIK